jgi:hypothetical protein
MPYFQIPELQERFAGTCKTVGRTKAELVPKKWYVTGLESPQ